MKTREIRELTGEELSSELSRLRRHIFDLRSQAVTEKLEDASLITKTKRDIARLLTILRERERGAEEERTQSERAGER